MPPKNYKLEAQQIRSLATGRGGCIASDRITVDGMPVGYMCRKEPVNDVDSGWAFLAGDEDPTYMDDPERHGVYDVNTIANYDPHIILFLDAPEGSEFVRGEDGLFHSVGELDAIEHADATTSAYIDRFDAGARKLGNRRGMTIAMWVLMATVVICCVAVVVAAG